MEKEEIIELVKKRESLAKEINEKQTEINNIDDCLKYNSGKIDYAGKAVLFSTTSYFGKNINRMLVNKCIYHKGYVTLYGSCIKVVQSEENPSVQFLENTDNNVMLREDDQTYIKVISEDEYNKFVSELCESMKKKTY